MVELNKAGALRRKTFDNKTTSIKLKNSRATGKKLEAIDEDDEKRQKDSYSSS